MRTQIYQTIEEQTVFGQAEGGRARKKLPSKMNHQIVPIKKRLDYKLMFNLV